MTEIKPGSYRKRDNPVQAMELKEDNIEAVAKWSGGRAGGAMVDLPTIDGIIPVSVGEVICRENTTGRFFAMEREEFDRLYYRPTRGAINPSDI